MFSNPFKKEQSNLELSDVMYALYEELISENFYSLQIHSNHIKESILACNIMHVILKSFQKRLSMLKSSTPYIRQWMLNALLIKMH